MSSRNSLKCTLTIYYIDSAYAILADAAFSNNEMQITNTLLSIGE